MSHPQKPAGSGQPTYEKKTGSNRKIIIGGIAIIAALAIFGGAFLLGQMTRGAVDPRGSGTGKVDPNGTLTVGLTLEPTNLDIRKTAGVALDQVLIDNVYQGLVGLTSDLSIQPVLAESYEVSEDSLTYTFTLNDGVTFHSGAALTAEDVAWSLNETRTNADFKANADLADIASVTAPDGSTVVVMLSQPNAQLLWLLAGRAGLIYEQAATIDYATATNGTGPYTLGTWKQGDSVTLTRVDSYWGDAATLKSVVFRYIKDGNAALNAALSGDIDVHTAVLPNLLSQYEGQENFTLVNAEGTDVFTLAYNSGRAPFDDPRVREAFSQAIDEDALIAAIENTGKPLGSPITSLEPGYVDLTSVNGYNPENAKKLLAEAGQENLTVTLTLSNSYDTDVPELLVSQLADVGVKLTLNQVEFPKWIEDVYTNKDYDLSFVDHAEARDFSNYANPDYYFNYTNPEVTALYEKSLRADGPEREDQLLQEAATLVAKDAPAKWLYNWTPTSAINNRVTGFPRAGTNSRINLAGVTVTE
ncbi:ABC transporter substrate-binding protein [Klugiella xanthotipulae]|uniref:Peptide/nickel transport system substrate-binding protein n=1 Tax=Klugiella xanthotipulae TaxID=244735 RepID=A0A543HYA1_9MICO|nr:ABC transporter substrate-binding protein [Klugiella xanthotipulae]TQM63279.1 peptide/nickel transport system substrate-binding protein [Klugiella xanthotipulae]